MACHAERMAERAVPDKRRDRNSMIRYCMKLKSVIFIKLPRLA